jgi:hypothetical protein
MIQMMVKVVFKEGADVVEVAEVVSEKFDQAEPVFYGELDLAQQKEEAEKLIQGKDDQVIIFANANDFPVMMASVVREAAWDIGYWCGASHEEKQYLNTRRIQVLTFVAEYGILYRVF